HRAACCVLARQQGLGFGDCRRRTLYRRGARSRAALRRGRSAARSRHRRGVRRAGGATRRPAAAVPAPTGATAEEAGAADGGLRRLPRAENHLGTSAHIAKASRVRPEMIPLMTGMNAGAAAKKAMNPPIPQSVTTVA